MRIVVDGRMLSWTGIGRYTIALLAQLQATDRVNDFTVLVRAADASRWHPTAGNFRRVICDIAPYSLAEQSTLPVVIRRLAPSVVHFVTPNAAALYRGRKVVTVHDLTLFDHSTSRGSLPRRLATTLKRGPFRVIVRRSLASATRILTDTEHVRTQLVERFDVDPAKISTAWLAADSDHLAQAVAAPLPGVDGSDTFLLYVGNYYPYKNVRALIEALALVSPTRPELKLVLAGRADEFTDDLLSVARTLRVSDRIVLPGFVTDGQLAWLYEHATLFVNPSFSEGFGLPGIEAMAHGLPVLASNSSCLPEVYGPAAVYFDPADPTELSRKMAELLDTPARRAELAGRGRERLLAFSWRRTAEITHGVYLDAAAEGDNAGANLR